MMNDEEITEEDEWEGRALADSIIGRRVLWYQTSYYSDDCHVFDLKLEDRKKIDIMDLFDLEYTPVEVVVRGGVETRSIGLFDDNYFWSTKVMFPGEAYIQRIEKGEDYNKGTPHRVFIGPNKP